jgi:hypothetical protein
MWRSLKWNFVVHAVRASGRPRLLDRRTRKGVIMNRRLSRTFLRVGFAIFASACAIANATGAEYEGKDGAAVAKMLPGAKVKLQQALTAAEAKGKPISAKYEMDEGKFQLSVYTSKGDEFLELLVDYKSGNVVKTEKIDQGEDLTNAKAQAEAMGSAKKSLKAAVDQAEREVAGGRAVSVTPTVSDGHAKAVVTVLKGGEYKSVTESLE